MEHLFVYGSLRPDDDSGEAWTASFCSQTSAVGKGRASGFALYHDTYATAVHTGDADNAVVGVVLKLTPSLLEEADRIEEYPELYTRTVSYVALEEGGEALAWIYIRRRADVPDTAKLIPSGDWMLRERSAQ